MGIERTKQDRSIRIHSMDSMLTEIIEPGKVRWWDIEEGHRRILLHLLVATLYCIRMSLSCIVKQICVIELLATRLAKGKQNTDTSFMIALYRISEHCAPLITPTTSWIAHTYPVDAWIFITGGSIYPQDFGGILWWQ